MLMLEFAAAPHPNPLPIEGNGEKGKWGSHSAATGELHSQS
jgi:hypothetical protein